MSEWMLTRRISRPPEDVFDFMTDPANTPSWLPSVQVLEQISPGPLTVGAKLREVRRLGGTESEAELQVTKFQRPHAYSVQATLGGLDASIHYTFDPEHGGTKVDVVCEVDGQAFSKAKAPIVAWLMKRQDKDQLKNVERLIAEVP